MSFEDAMATQATWVQWWVSWMGIVILGSMVALAFSKLTRRDALIILLTSLLVYVAMMWLYQQVGYVRLLGVVHVIVWTPLAYYFWRRLKDAKILTPFRQIIWVFLATIVGSLLFDYVDVARYLLGDRGSMVP